MLDHASLGVRDLDRATAFYDALLAPLGIGRCFSRPHGVGYGPPGGEDKLAIFEQAAAAPAGAGAHLALTASSPAAVDAAHAAGLAYGGRDEGPPGWRARYGQGYYAAFLRDPDGNKLELVHHASTP